MLCANGRATATPYLHRFPNLPTNTHIMSHTYMITCLFAYFCTHEIRTDICFAWDKLSEASSESIQGRFGNVRGRVRRYSFRPIKSVPATSSWKGSSGSERTSKTCDDWKFNVQFSERIGQNVVVHQLRFFSYNYRSRYQPTDCFPFFTAMYQHYGVFLWRQKNTIVLDLLWSVGWTLPTLIHFLPGKETKQPAGTNARGLFVPLIRVQPQWT